MEDNLQVNTNQEGSIEDSINMNFFQRLLGVIISPADTMKCLAEKPRVLFGILLTLITSLVYIIAVFPMYKEFTRNTLEVTYAKKGLSVTAEQMNSFVNITSITGAVGIVVVGVATLFLGTLILWGVVKIFKGEGRYKQYLSVSAYTAVFTALGTIVSLILTYVTGTFNATGFTNLASILPDMSGSFFYGMAKGLDLFTIWEYIVIAVGVSAVSKLSKKKSAIIVGCIFLAFLIYLGVSEIMSASALA